MLVPMVEAIQSENEMQGETSDDMNEEGDDTLLHEVCEKSAGQQVVESDGGEPVVDEVNGETLNQPSVLQEASAHEEIAHDEGQMEGDDDHGIESLKQHLTKEFEVKDLGQLRYFLGIEVS